MVRDLGLAVTGLLNPAMGGPGIQPPLPASLLNRPEFKSERLMTPSPGGRPLPSGRVRKHPADVPVSDAQGLRCGRPECRLPEARAVQHAGPGLTLLNGPAFAEFARAMGLRLVRECRDGADERIRLAFRIALARPPDVQEPGSLRVYQDHRALYDADPDATAGLLVGELLPTGVSPPEAAAWIAVARTMLNLEEFITRE